MARSRYEYSTSPRKIKPEQKPKKTVNKRKLEVVKQVPRQQTAISKEQIKRQSRITLIIMAIFISLLTISYRNSQINEKFSEVQSLKRELSSLQKEDEQLNVSIENSLNLNTIEKLAKEKLGMQKLTSKQTIYITLPKRDYVEPANEEIIVEKEKNWFEKFVDKIFNR